MELKKSLRRLSKFGSSKIKKNSLQLVEEKFEIKEKVNKKNISSPTLKSKSWKSGKSVKSGTSKNKKNLKIGLNCNKNNRFEIKKLLGEGSFSKMYLSYDKTIEKEVALKVEKQDKHKKILVHEYDILRNLQCLNTVPRVIDFINATSSNFIVMELLGMNISCFKKLFNPNEFICVDLLIKMFNCIEKLHETGYIHRDIKPSNFVLSKNCQDEIAVLNTLKMTDKNNSFSNTFSSSFMAQIEVYMIDFGLSKFHLDKNGNAFPAKKNCDFQGTLIYASINAHLKKELSRRDDLWSFFFVMIEFLNFELPWREKSKKMNKEELGKTKELCIGNPESFLIKGRFSEQLKLFLEHLKTLEYNDKPNYKFLKEKLEEIKFKIVFDENKEEYDYLVKKQDEVKRKNSTELITQTNTNFPILNNSSQKKKSQPNLLNFDEITLANKLCNDIKQSFSQSYLARKREYSEIKKDEETEVEKPNKIPLYITNCNEEFLKENSRQLFDLICVYMNLKKPFNEVDYSFKWILSYFFDNDKNDDDLKSVKSEKSKLSLKYENSYEEVKVENNNSNINTLTYLTNKSNKDYCVFNFILENEQSDKVNEIYSSFKLFLSKSKSLNASLKYLHKQKESKLFYCLNNTLYSNYKPVNFSNKIYSLNSNSFSNIFSFIESCATLSLENMSNYFNLTKEIKKLSKKNKKKKENFIMKKHRKLQELVNSTSSNENYNNSIDFCKFHYDKELLIQNNNDNHKTEIDSTIKTSISKQESYINEYLCYLFKEKFN